MTTAKQKERVFKAAMRWFDWASKFPIRVMLWSNEDVKLFKACAAAARGRKK